MGRYDVCDMTIDGTDPRFSLWDRIECCYVPGYWPSREQAEAAARVMAETTIEQYDKGAGECQRWT